MKKPNNYEATQASGDFTPIELGGHRMVIKSVEEMVSKTGKDMVKIQFDFAGDDRQPGYFWKQFENDIRPDKKYPNQATQYILTEDNDGNCSRSFKTFVTCIEQSNAGFKVQWGDKFCQCFTGKKVGGVFGEQMDYYNGDEKKKRVLRWFCSLDKAADASIPDMSETKAYKEYKQGGTAQGGGSYDDGFMTIPDGIDEELPFN